MQVVLVVLPPELVCCQVPVLEKQVCACRHGQWRIRVVWVGLPQEPGCDRAWVSEPQALGCTGAEANGLHRRGQRRLQQPSSSSFEGSVNRTSKVWRQIVRPLHSA